MTRIKGSLLMEVARLIRASKDKDWKKYLTDKDLEIIHSRVLASSWYTLDTYERASIAVFHEIAGGSNEAAKGWGRFVMEDVIKKFYPNMVRENDMMIALEKFKIARLQWFQFDDPQFKAMEIEPLGNNQAKIIIRSDHPVPFEAFTYQLMGSYERLIELCGRTKVKSEIKERDWKATQPYSVLVFSWE